MTRPILLIAACITMTGCGDVAPVADRDSQFAPSTEGQLDSMIDDSGTVAPVEEGQAEEEAAAAERERQAEAERRRQAEEDARQQQPEENPPKDPPEDDCENTRDLIYVIDRAESALYLYDPEARSYELLGELDCGAFAGDPASMSVSRSGTAFVRYRDNTVYAVDLTTMECEETDYEHRFGSFGMGFVTQHANTWEDQLYVANRNELAVLNTEDWSMTTIGRLPSQSELTGNARGELWAMLPLEQPAQLVRLSQATGAVTASHALPGFPNPREIDTFAFATWGGEFYLFVRRYGMGRSTDIYRVAADGSFQMHQESSGRDVVGAGVSTCVPVE